MNEIPAQGRKPRVLIYTMNYAPEFISTGRYTAEIGSELRRLGAQVDVVTTPPHYPGWSVKLPYRNRYSRESDECGSIYRTPLILKEQMRGVARLLAPLSWAMTSLPVALWRLFTRRYDYLLSVEPTLFPAPFAALAARMRGTRTILHVQDLEIDGAFEVGHLKMGRTARGLALAFERVTLRLFDRVITISTTMRQRLHEKGARPEQVTLIRNWVDLDRIRSVADTADYRRELGVPQDAFVIQYAGSIGAKQGLNLLCEAAERLQSDTRLQFLLAGGGPDRPRLEARFGHLSNLRFVDLQPEERIGAFLSLADLHVIPQLATSTDFALPSKLGGILASGRPLVVMAKPGQELSLFLGGAAEVIPPGDSALLAKAIADASNATTDPQSSRRAHLAQQLSRANAMRLIAAEFAIKPQLGEVAGVSATIEGSPERRSH